MTYLAFDPSWKKWGRLERKEIDGSYFRAHVSNGETWRVISTAEHDQLQIHDWVALTADNKIIQVTPSLRSPRTATTDSTTLQLWSTYLQQLHLFFSQKQFLQIQTPLLVDSAGTEPSLDPFSTTLTIQGQQRQKFLPTSPELHLKKSLSAGFLKIYEVSRCFRNGEVTQIHQPEFHMLEWYRGFANLDEILLDCVDLISFLAQALPTAKKPKAVQCWTLAQLFKTILNVDLKSDWTRQDYFQLAKSLDLRINESFSIDDLFFLIMLEKIEPTFDLEHLVFVESYPPFQAALARKNEHGWAQRFEMYWQGMELANAFNELNDPREQRERAIEDLKLRGSRRREIFDGKTGLDEDFFQALESGMPPSSGIALGVERLFMALLGIREISKTRLFPLS